MEKVQLMLRGLVFVAKCNNFVGKNEIIDTMHNKILNRLDKCKKRKNKAYLKQHFCSKKKGFEEICSQMFCKEF